MRQRHQVWRTAGAAAAALLLLGVPVAWAQGRAPPVQIGYRAAENALASLSVTFVAQAAPGSRLEWDFGDGSTGSGTTAEHVFYRPQTYRVSVRVFDAQGRPVARAGTTLEVKSAGPERAALTLLLAPGSVRLSEAGSVSYAPHTARYWLDGQEVPLSRSGSTIKTEAVALAPGKHTATLRLEGSDGPLQSTVTFTTAPVSTSEPFALEVLRLTNQARAQGYNCQTNKAGGPALPPLTRDPTLDIAATAQSMGLALGGYFDHQSTIDGSGPYDRVRATGLKVSRSGENIAAGQTTPAEVVQAWLRSPGHCRNIMGNFSHIGLSYVYRAEAKSKTYWTQVFASP